MKNINELKCLSWYSTDMFLIWIDLRETYEEIKDKIIKILSKK